MEQRHRALNAFLADAYRAAGRRRGDADRAPEMVRAGVLPGVGGRAQPRPRHPDAVGQAWPGQPRADRGRRGRAADAGRRAGWRAADHLRVPAGLGYALANRDSARAALPELSAAAAPADPWDAVAGAARRRWPPRRRRARGTPRIAVLTAGESDNAWFEHRLLADALGVPLARAGGPLAAAGRRGRGRRRRRAARRSTCSTGGSTTACSAPSGRPPGSRWTCC